MVRASVLFVPAVSGFGRTVGPCSPASGSAAVLGIDAYVVDVETDIANSDFRFPLKRITG